MEVKVEGWGDFYSLRCLRVELTRRLNYVKEGSLG